MCASHIDVMKGRDTMTDNLYDRLEKLIDESSLQEVIERIVHICYEKAEHVRTNWQNEALARIWEHNASKLERIPARLKRTF
jgi:FixJ family two-component response regulator